MHKRGTVNIIAGEWRSRPLRVLEQNSIRPTASRVRETLFNWLSPMIQKARCLDLFAGSGILGFEALSRGAQYVVMVDCSLPVVHLLREQLARFNAESAAIVYHRTILPAQLHRILPLKNKLFNVIFLDPPYASCLLLSCCLYLEKYRFLADYAYLYLEAQRVICAHELPINWRIIHCKQAGQVIYHLVERKKE